MNKFVPSIHSSIYEITGTKSELLKNKRIVIGMTGSVAVVEIVHLARSLMRHGATVFVGMTKAATELIQPDLIEWAVGNPVITKLTGQIEHVHLCGEHPDKADLLLIAPSTANTIGKIAGGVDDTVVTTFATTALGTGIPIAIVPAMHATMYENPIVVENIEKLKKIGVQFIGPRIEEGKAKIATVEQIIESIIGLLTPNDFKDKHFVITAGPTRIWIDDVRFISNPSSGKMGINLALEAISRGAKVTLLLGPTTEKVVLPEINVVNFETPDDLLKQLDKIKEIDYYISAAAIGDYAPDKADGKISSKQKSLTLKLKQTPKIITFVKEKFTNSVIIAFKAEAGLSRKELETKALKSLKENNYDLIIANAVKKGDQGFASDENAVLIISQKGLIKELKLASKRIIAKRIFTVLHKQKN